MSLFSSLILFYPGRPPLLKLREVRTFWDRLRDALSLRDVLLAVDIKYGKSIDQDFDTTNKMEWEDTNSSVRTGRFVRYNWDHEKRKDLWPDLWPKPAFDSRVLYRAYIGLGGLPRTISTELTAMRDHETTYEFIAPDALSLQIDPICPATLDAKNLECDCYGLIELSFSGNGTWQSLSCYWEAIRQSSTIPRVLQLCRETFPVPRLEMLERMKEDLGELFLNRHEYQEGLDRISLRNGMRPNQLTSSARDGTAAQGHRRRSYRAAVRL